MSRKINPTLAGGLRDYLPEDMIPRQEMLDTIREVFERFGFVPLDTPALEKEEILTGGDQNFDKQIFRIASNKDDKETSGLALRFDLTVPLARVFAANSSSLTRPFKRYQIGKVFRGESAQMGRYREFTQCDADIVASDSLMADAEIIALIYETLKSLGIEKFKIKINNRALLNRKLEELLGSEAIKMGRLPRVLRAIDKLDRGTDEFTQALKLASYGTGTASKIKAMLDDLQPDDELKSIFRDIENFGVNKENYEFNKYIARGLGYYTGIVFETFLDDMPEIGSICSGGRYDGLVERFSSERVPAVGVSIGIDRLYVALEKLGKIKKRKTIADVLVLNFDKACEGDVLKIATDLRHGGIKTDIYLGKEETFKGQFAYGVSHEYPVLVIFGSKERERGIVQVRNMKKHEQIEVPSDELVGKVKELVK